MNRHRARALQDLWTRAWLQGTCPAFVHELQRQPWGRQRRMRTFVNDEGRKRTWRAGIDGGGAHFGASVSLVSPG